MGPRETKTRASEGTTRIALAAGFGRDPFMRCVDNARLADALDDAVKLLDNCRFSGNRPDDKTLVKAIERLRALLREVDG